MFMTAITLCASLRIELHSSFVRTNRAVVPKSSTTFLPPTRASMRMVILDRQLRFSATDMLNDTFQLFPSSTSETQCKTIRRFYGKIPGNQLPVHIPLFLRASACRTFLEIKKL